MNLDNLNKWLMLVANLGVLAGVFFLAQELSQNAASLEIAARGSQAANVARINELVISNEILSASLAKIEFSAWCNRPNVELIEKLSPQERLVVRNYIAAGFFSLSNNVYIIERELGSEGSLFTLARMIPWMRAFELNQTRAAEELLTRNNFDISSSEYDC